LHSLAAAAAAATAPASIGAAAAQCGVESVTRLQVTD
jgi:hypothetical protein